MRTLILTILAVFFTSSAWANLKARDIEYKDGETFFEGYLAYDDHFTGKRPGVLVVHEWMGLNDYAKMRADMLARLGYVAFAVDIYGKDVRPKNTEEAAAESTKYKNNRSILRERARAGLNVLRRQLNVDASRLAAIGYCFGGTTVLELARSGADLKGVVSFHGGLSTPAPQDAQYIKARILVLHGANDPFVSANEVKDFKEEMKKAGVKFQFISYPGAVHGFTNPANKGELKGALYNPQADRESWNEMRGFLRRVFK